MMLLLLYLCAHLGCSGKPGCTQFTQITQTVNVEIHAALMIDALGQTLIV
jgi:hypothetical protein